jgi:hypothetical protein
MIGNGEMPTGRVIVDHVRTPVVVIAEAELGKRFPGFLP